MSDDLRKTFSSKNEFNSKDDFFEGTGNIMANHAEVNCECPQPGPETIEVEQVLGAEMKQKVVEFDMFLPAQKPDIEQVVDVYVKKVEINTVDVIRDKVIIRGDLEVKVMYVADLPNQPVHAFEKRHVRFTRDIDLPGAMQGMDATADVTVEYVNFEFHKHHDKRKVYITIVLKFWARVIVTTEMDVYALGPVTDVSQMDYTTANGTIGTSSGQFSDDSVSASQLGGGDIYGYGTENMLITGQGNMSETGPGYMSVEGMVPTAGTSMGASGTGTINGTNVNIRTGPGTNFPVLTKIDKGVVVTIKEQAFGWYKIVFADGKTGWVASWLVDTGNGVPAKPKG